MMNYYPLTDGNKWEYRQKDGSTYTNQVLEITGNIVTMKNSNAQDVSVVKVENGCMYNELMEKNNFQLWLKDEFNLGEQWNAVFKANSLDSVLTFTVKEIGISKLVENVNYSDIVMLEAESKINMNGNLVSTQFFTQYYYAKGIGLVLTTSSMGDYHGLIAYNIL